MSAVALRYPFSGRWVARNSPADRLPSHGTHAFATTHAVDFVPVDGAGRSAPVRFATLLASEPPDLFVGFGRALSAPIAGTIIAAHDGEPDHPAHRGIPSLGYALTQARRAAQGWTHLAGNHVVIRAGDVCVALCHLQQGSVAVAPGAAVEAGSILGRCGNSGNSTEPHVHVQAMDDPDPVRAHGVPVLFDGRMPRNGEIVEVPDA
jgi:murein DD-endopeptidase MepM/ murein hydrolase activator NlpD